MDKITLTGSEARIGGITNIDLTKAVDMSDYDTVLYSILLTCVITSGTPSLTISIYGGTQRDSIDGWVSIASQTFTGSNAVGGDVALVSAPFVPQFVTWEASAFTGLSEVGLSIVARANRRASMLP